MSIAYNELGDTISTSENTAKGNLITTQTDYYWTTTPDSYCKNQSFYNMIYKTGKYYWLASRYVFSSSPYAYFGLRVISSTGMGGHYLFISNGDSRYVENYIRPVVTLSSNVSVLTNDNDNSETNMWTLKQF